MIVAINYANEKYKRAQRFNSKRAYRFGADKVIEYSRKDIDDEFVQSNLEIFNSARGDGYWLWKPYIIRKTLETVEYGDYVVYTDAGSVFVDRISLLIDDMTLMNTDIMAFSIERIEKEWSKRDAFITMECDIDLIANTPQICGGYIIVKKSDYSVGVIDKYLEYSSNTCVNTDAQNVLGKTNYEGFVENRHDQTAWSLLCKREGIKPFRDPSQWGLDYTKYPEDIIERSHYPQVIESHRRGYIQYFFQLEYNKKWWFYPLRKAVRGYYKILRLLGNSRGELV